MAKQKWICHICNNDGKLAEGTPLPEICPICAANLANTSDEGIKWHTVVNKQAGGIKGDLVTIKLTNRRLIFQGSKVGGTGFLVGGIIGGAIEGAINAAKTNANMSWLPVDEIASFSDEVTGLLKNQVLVTVNSKDGNGYSMKISKKDFEKFGIAVKQFIS